MIVVEGMDNSGKSTLAQALAEYMGLFVQESEGPPRDADEINARVDRYQETADRYVFVRHPCISNAIYGAKRPEGNPITPGRTLIFYEAQPTLIYCDAGGRGFDGHQVKDHDSPEHLEMITREHDDLLRAYRLWAAEHAHFVYRIGDDMDRFISAVYFFHCWKLTVRG